MSRTSSPATRPVTHPWLNDKSCPDAPPRDVCTHTQVDINRRYFVEAVVRVIYWIFIDICSKKEKTWG